MFQDIFQVLMKLLCFRFLNIFLFVCFGIGLIQFLGSYSHIHFFMIYIIYLLMPDLSLDTEGKFSLCKTKGMKSILIFKVNTKGRKVIKVSVLEAQQLFLSLGLSWFHN